MPQNPGHVGMKIFLLLNNGGTMMHNTFEFTPTDSLTHFFFILILFLFLGLLVVFSVTYMKSTRQSVALSSQGLSLKVPLYGRVIPLSDILVSEALVVDLNVDQQYRAKWRTVGVGLPGYKLGWYKIKTGERALLAINHSDIVVYLPTKKGYSLLLSLKDPKEFLSSLGKLAAEN